MPLLAEYAITPDVFDVASYTSEEVCGLYLDKIREPMLTEGLVRDLRNGEWRRSFASDARAWHRWGKELIRKLATQGRLIQFPPELPGPPPDDRGWCAEALATRSVRAFTGGVVVTGPVKSTYPNEPLVARINQLENAQWWAARSPSVTLTRTFADYERHLDPVLRCSNSLLFIDPYLDPAKDRYREIGALLALAGDRTPAPRIEIHRGSREGRRDKEGSYFEHHFREKLADPLRAAGLQAEVFVWDDFHDRFLISNLIGISLPNGFDTAQDPNALTRWTRLGRGDRDDVQREFDVASKRHKLQWQFTIP